jgi:hypothetical protein
MRMKRRDFLRWTLAGTGAAVLPGVYSAWARETGGGAFDVVVYGASSAGITAAVQAARLGRSVVLVEPSGHLGGLTTGGLGKTDSGIEGTIGGISREFYRRVRDYYDDPRRWVHETREAYMHPAPGQRNRMLEADGEAQWGFEPHVAKRIYEEMLREAGVPVVLEDRLVLDRRRGVRRNGTRIEAIVTEAGNEYRGRVFIDATYEGDLVAMAGVSYHVGRESNDTYGERLNGVQKARSHNHVFVVDVDPYVRPGEPASGLLPDIHDWDPGEDGEGDHRVQAYCYRMCLSDAPGEPGALRAAGGLPRAAMYELLLRNLEAGDTRMPWLPGAMPNRKTDTNNRWAVSTNNIGQNYAYPGETMRTRARDPGRSRVVPART